MLDVVSLQPQRSLDMANQVNILKVADRATLFSSMAGAR